VNIIKWIVIDHCLVSCTPQLHIAKADELSLDIHPLTYIKIECIVHNVLAQVHSIIYLLPSQWSMTRFQPCLQMHLPVKAVSHFRPFPKTET